MVAVLFHRRMLRAPTERVRLNPGMPWQKHLYTLYGTSFVIWVRSIFRLIEFGQGRDGYLMSTEVYLYIFDALLMFTIMVWLAIVHPSEVYALLKGGKHKSIYKVRIMHNSAVPHALTCSQVIFTRQMPMLESKSVNDFQDGSMDVFARA